MSMESAVQRWNEILDARAQQMDAAYARLGRTSADFGNAGRMDFIVRRRIQLAAIPFISDCAKK